MAQEPPDGLVLTQKALAQLSGKLLFCRYSLGSTVMSKRSKNRKVFKPMIKRWKKEKIFGEQEAMFAIIIIIRVDIINRFKF